MAASISPKLLLRLRAVGSVFLRSKPCDVLRTASNFSLNKTFSTEVREQRAVSATPGAWSAFLIQSTTVVVPFRRFATSNIRLDETEDGAEVKPKLSDEPSDAELQHAIEYLQSEEYDEKYGDKPVWANYKRNHKGRIPPMKTRKMCIRGQGEKRRTCGNPCPLCRDSSLIIHHKNVRLLEQFICPHSWNIYTTYRTGVCQKQYKKLCATIEKARKHGLLPYNVPFIKFNYEDYDHSQDPEEKKSAQL